jgi:hypothetical protein
MTVDLTGGLDPEREFVFAAQPDDPEMRESVNVWVWDEGDAVGLPRIGVEAVADQWETHDVQVNIALAGGRVVTMFQPGEVHDAHGADGRARVLGAGPLSFELVEPFRHWRARLAGTGTEIAVDDQLAGWFPGGEGAPVDVELELDIRSVVPPWEPGTLREEAGRVLATQEEGALMGGPRFEQLFRATGRLRVGDEHHELDGGGLRIRRQGVRRLAAFRGHAWQSAVFPDGRAFGYIVYPPRDDGKPTFDEGYLFDGDGTLVPARVVEAPWLRDLQASGQDVSVVLETERGTTAIRGETVLSTFMVVGPLEGFRLQQAIVRYDWDGQRAHGMLERSTAADG